MAMGYVEAGADLVSSMSQSEDVASPGTTLVQRVVRDLELTCYQGYPISSR